MKRTDLQALIEPFLADRLRPLTTADLGNGTPLADAVASVLAFDMATGCARIAKRIAAEVAKLTDDQLLETIGVVREAIGQRDGQYKGALPYGATVKSTTHPGLDVEHEKQTSGGPRRLGTTLYPLRGVPGLHERDVRGLDMRPGARMLREAVVAAMATLPASDVPPPGIDDVVVESTWRWRDTLFVPMRGGPGVTFTHSENTTISEHMLDIDIALQAAATREHAATILKASRAVDRAYAKTIALIQPLLEKAKRDGIHFRFDGVHVESRHGVTTVRPKFEVLGNDLKPTSWEAMTNAAGGLPAAIEGQMGVQRRRKRILDQAGGLGGRGRVDEITLRAIRALTDDPAELLRRIASQRNVTVQAGRNGKKSDPVRLAWRDGRVESCFAITDKATWNYNRIIFKGIELPEAVIITLKGKPVSTLVEHPFLDGGHTIRSITGRSGGWLFANLDVAWTVFDAETGETIDVAPPAAMPQAEAEQDKTADDRPRQGDLLELLS